MRVAVIGSQGVPARYGGFETLVENLIGEHRRNGMEYTIMCSSPDRKSFPKEYKGAKLVYFPLHANGFQSIFYDLISMLYCIGKKIDAMLILGISGCVFLPFIKLLYRGRIIVNIDGIEHRRQKWSLPVRHFLKLSEIMAVYFADVVITDNVGIKQYILEKYKKQSKTIAYGGDHVLRNLSDDYIQSILNKYGLEKGKYAITVCRIEPENHCHTILQAFSHTDRKLLFIGNWEHSSYGRHLREIYSRCPGISTLSPIYDLDELYALRSCAGMYVHGHSAGGTNPSLVEAMFFGIKIAAFDVVFNRVSTDSKAKYFSDTADLQELVSNPASFGPDPAMREVAEQKYLWRQIVSQYESCYPTK